MKELLKINYEAEQPTVSARDLHEALEIRERFSLWFSRYVDVFEKGTDYQSVGKPTVVNNGAKRVLDDFLLSTDMAKHISMMTKTEKGKIMRQYFIDLEKAWNTPEQIFARALKMADQKIEKLKETYLMKTGSSRNMPTQRYVADGLFQIKETVISNPDGSVRMTKTTKVTGKGQQYFLNKYLKNKEAV